MAETLRALSDGGAVLPLRTIVPIPGRGAALGVMPAVLPGPGVAGVAGAKVITVFPSNRGTELDSHQGAVLLFEAERGRLLAMVDATSVTTIRTAAVSAVATRALAREDAGDLAILGSGVQARSHLEAMLAVREIRRIRVWGRTGGNAERFAEEASSHHGRPVEVCSSAREAVEGADLVCTVTGAAEPVLLGAWVAPGTHVNAVGMGPIPTRCRELDGALMAGARLFADRRESALNEAGDVVLAIEEGSMDAGHIAGEIGEVLAGTVPGRTSPDEVTVFESLGLAVEDLAAADLVQTRALEKGLGTKVRLGGARYPG
jgi:alanine dehydrogenase